MEQQYHQTFLVSHRPQSSSCILSSLRNDDDDYDQETVTATTNEDPSASGEMEEVGTREQQQRARIVASSGVPSMGELRALQASRNRSRMAATQRAQKQQDSQPLSEERDLFIPIFSLLSLAGLFGAYGYEMVRLAARGELYLPWN